MSVENYHYIEAFINLVEKDINDAKTNQEKIKNKS